MWTWEACMVKMEPASVALFFTRQLTSWSTVARTCRKLTMNIKKKQQSYEISSVIQLAPINISTSSHTDVVSLPVKRYCPTKIVSPSFTTYSPKRRRIWNSYEDLQRKDVKMMMQRKKASEWNPKMQRCSATYSALIKIVFRENTVGWKIRLAKMI